MTRPKPPLKYPGGKRAHLPAILAAMDPLEGITRYMEPFVGGGAVALGLRSGGWTGRMYLSDLNPGTAAVWRALAGPGVDLEAVIEEIEAFLAAYGSASPESQEAAYYRLRDEGEGWDRRLLSDAARTILLNRLGFNGLVRVNRAGKINVPWGGAKSVTIIGGLRRGTIFAAASLRATAALLQSGPVHVLSAHYAILLLHAGSGDLVFLDPPYLGGFVGYTKEGWSEEDHIRLVGMAADAVRRGARVVVTDSVEDRVRQRWASAGFLVGDLQERRTINRDGDGRSAVGCTLAWTAQMTIAGETA